MNMQKSDRIKPSLCIQYDDHPRVICTVLGSLMENQSLVDLAICCGNKTMHAHKCVLAACSPYFREELENNPGAEQVIIDGLDFINMKSIIEFIYCGETIVLEENMKYVVAAAKLFQIQGLQALISAENNDPGEEPVCIPSPVFINKKPKYSIDTTIDPFTSIEQLICNQLMFQDAQTILDANTSTYQEAYCNETLIDDECIRELETSPMNAVNYGDLSTPSMSAPLSELNKNVTNDLTFTSTGDKTAEEVENDRGQDMSKHVGYMYQISEGQYLEVIDEVLRNITDEMLQFQVNAENAHPSNAKLLSDKLKLKVDDEESHRVFKESFKTLISIQGGNAGTSANLDLDSIFFNVQESNDEQPANDNVEEASDEHLETFDHEHSDILSEINSMQFYDNSVYEDIAEKVETALKHQQREVQQEIVPDEGQ